MGDYHGYNSGRKRNLLPTANLKFSRIFPQFKRKYSFIKVWKKYVWPCIRIWCVCIPEDNVCRLVTRGTKTPQVLFLFADLKPWNAQKERDTWGSEWKPQHVEPTVLDIWCDLCDHEHLSWQGAGSKGGVSCGATRKKLEGIANGDDIKNRPSDLLVPWLVSKHSVLQFSYYQVLFPQHDKVRTLGRASDSRRKILQQLRQKIMT